MVRGLNSSEEGELGWMREFAKGTFVSSYARLFREEGTDGGRAYRFQEKVPQSVVVQV